MSAGGSANASAAADGSQQGQSGGQSRSSAGSQSAQSAQDALNQLSNDAAAAGERQRAASQLESSRNALERALGRTQSRSGSNGRSSSSSSSGQRSQSSSTGQPADQGQGGTHGQPGDQTGSGADGAGAGTPGSDQGNGGDTGQGGGYSTGGQTQNRAGTTGSGLDAITRPEQVPTSGGFAPDQSSVNPYLGDAGTGGAQTAPESVQPSYSNKPTQGNDTGAIPLGLRDLVKDYFSSLDQK
jgi:hypothetical protein